MDTNFTTTNTRKSCSLTYSARAIANSKYLTWKTHFAPLILLENISDHNVNQKKNKLSKKKKKLSPTSKISCPTYKTYNVVKYKSIFVIIIFPEHI